MSDDRASKVTVDTLDNCYGWSVINLFIVIY